MHIGILQTGHAPDTLREAQGDYSDMFARLLDGHGFRFSTWDVVDMDFPAGPDAAEGWIITGSRHGAYEDLPFIAPLETLIRDIHAAGRPMVGICFGHQIIAQALGGRVEKFAGGWSVGRTEYDLDGRRVALNAWHQDQVVALPEGARVIGASPFCANAALAYGNRIWTLQPHPEFQPRFIDGLIRTRGKGVVPDAQLAEAAAALDLPLDTAAIAADMAAVLKGDWCAADTSGAETAHA